MRFPLFALVSLLSAVVFPTGQPKYSWRYYRPGNTGIQGDTNQAVWVGPDNDPWIGGYTPIAEEGGIAKFIQAENRWVNVSNIDYPVIGSANDVGYSNVNDIVADGNGNLWIATFRGALRMNLSKGPQSLVRFGPGNSALPGGNTRDIAMAPDGSVWFSVDSTVFGGGGVFRYNPTTHQWTSHFNHGGSFIAVQPKPGGGYFVWASQLFGGAMERYDSSTGAWTGYATTAGNPAYLTSHDSTDASGNVWMTRWFGNQGESRVDVIRPDGTWVSPPLPPQHPQVNVAALRAFGNMQALMINGYADLYRFNGTAWTLLGPVPLGGFIDDLEIDSDGNIWSCGSSTGGAFKRNAATGLWQRYRITNTSQYDLFNNDLTLDPVSGVVYACANAGPGYGGMVKFDGTRWTGFNNHHYGLGVDWPFPTDNSEAVHVRPSDRKLVVNPYAQYSHLWDGASYAALSGGPDQVETYEEDSLGRLWVTGHYGGLGYFDGPTYSLVSGGGMFSTVKRDPSRAGTVWANLDWEIRRTDGATTLFSRDLASFGYVGAGSFTGLAVQPNGVCWTGIWVQFTPGSGTLLRIDPATGAVQQWRDGVNWPFPGDFVRPLGVTPDGKLWMSYDSEYPSTDAGLLWWDGTSMKTFPAPPNGEWRWGGLPHAGITDFEIKPVAGGYELWMSCISRGIAVLRVQYPVPAPVR